MMVQTLLKVIFPSSCVACNQLLLTNEVVLCLRCRIHLPITNHVFNPLNEAKQKFYAFPKVTAVCCFLYFKKQTTTQQIFHQLKYNNQPNISLFLGTLFCEQLSRTTLLNEITEIIPVPLHRKRKQSRGYNQVDGFAKALAIKFNLPVNTSILSKTKNTKSQTKKKKSERLNLSKTDFLVRPKKTKQENHFLLIDDILTTGSTLTTCVELLTQLPNTKITILCLAMTSQRF